MASLRSSEVESLLIQKKLVKNVLLTNREAIQHYHYIRQLLIDIEPIFGKVAPGFSEIKEIAMSDVVELWRRASLPVIKTRSVQLKLKKLIEKFLSARKRTKKRNSSCIREGWLDVLFDLS